jgi:hypothetical protein
MTVYGPSNVDSVSVSGTGHSHEREKNEKNMAVSCLACEPELVRSGWSTDAREIPLTYDELRDAERTEKEIVQHESKRIKETAKAAADAVRGGANRANETRVRANRSGSTR